MVAGLIKKPKVSPLIIFTDTFDYYLSQTNFTHMQSNLKKMVKILSVNKQKVKKANINNSDNKSEALPIKLLFLKHLNCKRLNSTCN